MANATLHNHDVPAMPENSFTCIGLTNRQIEKDTRRGGSISHDGSKAAASDVSRQVAKQWHVSLSIMKRGSHGTKHWEWHRVAHPHTAGRQMHSPAVSQNRAWCC